MKLKSAYARFYKSFNFDHARKLNPRVERRPWEMFRERFYPYVTVEFDRRITTVVGANESGKSHLLSVVKKAITGKNIEQRDLCRYSPYFGVGLGQRCWPHVGVGWDQVSRSEADAIAEASGFASATFTRFLMFREEPNRLTVWIPQERGGFSPHELDETHTTRLEELLPKPFEIDNQIALPNSIPFSFIEDGADAIVAGSSRSMIERMLRVITEMQPFVSNPSSVQQHSDRIASALSGLAAPIGKEMGDNDYRSLELGRSLLLQLGEVDPKSLIELSHGIDQQHDGYVGGLLEAVNRQLDRKLNFRRYWVQDRDFSLKVATRDRELVFMISDRTGTVYTFSERSSGLRYFLSYLIQAQIHRPSSDRESILLMDEPDTYLSAEAQQDLMRVFRALAEPEQGTEPIQVVYVTHSPFLLDKNHSERIRVLEKGTGYDGTRVVPSVSRNHYEPLRSAFGAFVGESAFVGSVNLLVEGASDQIILAGAANLTRALSPGILEETLDLNRMVIVPSGSAQEIGYTVFRIRGQGADKPPVVVLLDGDREGVDAKVAFSADTRLRKLIKRENILDLAQLGEGIADWPAAPVIEDLVPVALVHRTVAAVIEEITKFREGEPPAISLQKLEAELANGGPMLTAVNREVGRHGGRIDKIAFAKALIDICQAPDEVTQPHVDVFLGRMRLIFRAVNDAVRNATDDAANKKLEAIVEDRIGLFRVDNPLFATREQAQIVLRQVEAQLDDSPEAEAIKAAMVPFYRIYRLNEDPAELVTDYDTFLEGLTGLKHAYRAQVAGTVRPQTGKAAAQAEPNETEVAVPVAKAKRRKEVQPDGAGQARRRAASRSRRAKGAPAE